MSDLFYRAFEERYYAPRHVIRQLRRQYLPFVEPLKSVYPGVSTFDLGCGRGEWLDLMLEAGFDALGVDLDEGMLEGCRELELPAHHGDAVAYLGTLPDNSHAVISAFHVVEHISFEQLTQVVVQALRVLKPGGLLIMETPNPENIVVATRNFYLDPTHLRPIPSQLLSFLPEYYGYARTKVLRMQESRTLLQNATLGLHDVFAGASPDYAVIAQKNARGGVLEKFDDVFSREYGLSLESLSSHYDAGINGPFKRLQARFDELEERTKSALAHEQSRTDSLNDEIQARLHQVEVSAQAGTVRALLEQQLVKAEQDLQQLHHRVIAAEQQVQAMLNSTSWRITAPLRGLRTTLASLLRLPLRLLRACIRPIMLAIMRFVIARPHLANRLAAFLRDYPWLHSRLRLFAIHRGVIEQAESQPLSTNAQAGEVPPGLTPHAHRIFNQLKTAIKNDRLRE